MMSESFLVINAGSGR